MTPVCERLKEFKTPHRPLIGSFFGKQMMLETPLLQWYIYYCLVIRNVTSFICYEPVTCFKEFTKEIANARQAAEEKGTVSAESNKQKLQEQL